MKVVIVDCFDSFTFNLKHYIEAYESSVTVMRYDQIDWDILNICKYIVLSPGPGLPSDYPLLNKILQDFSTTKSILGVCLGLQTIACFYGAQLLNMKTVLHGKKTSIKIDDSAALFKGLPSMIEVGRYHSWAIKEGTMPIVLHGTAYDSNHYVMALVHTKYNIHAVQFHPESIMTECGKKIIFNWLNGNLNTKKQYNGL